MSVYLDDEYRALVDAIREQPEDDLPRLIAADWLEEHGESERATFIRVQCELAKVQECPKCKKNKIGDMGWTNHCRGQRCKLKRLEYKSSCRKKYTDWRPGWGRSGEYALYNRGFIYGIMVDMGAWFGQECQLLPAHPWGVAPCLRCDDSNFEPGKGPMIVQQEPILSVTFNDRQPDQGDGYFWDEDTDIIRVSHEPRWMRALPRQQRHDVPTELFDLLTGEVVVHNDGRRTRWYESDDQATHDLSRASLVWATETAKSQLVV